MQLGKVIGHATSTVKHPSMNGWKLLVVQTLDAKGGADGEPVLVVDNLGAGAGQRVMITSDGKAVSQMLGDDKSPVRWAVIGIADEEK
ncbi:MAG: EutN/CcmL family microcompartment protein [Planctomycetaceae bacterium]|nr:EutN/CcmL family microcompartment protein [Planctomycetaceae bacterium]